LRSSGSGPPAAAGRHLGEPDDERPAHDVGRQRPAHPARVAAQEPDAVRARLLGVDLDVAVGADAGRAAVDVLEVGRRRHGAVGGGHALPRPRGQLELERAVRACGGGEHGGRERFVPEAQHGCATQPQTTEAVS
jgi:hypothetical protein